MSSNKLELFRTECGSILEDGEIHCEMAVFPAIDSIRRDLGLSIGDFMNLIHRHPTLYSKWRNGEARPNEETVRIIEKVVGGKFRYEEGEIVDFEKNTDPKLDFVRRTSNVVDEIMPGDRADLIPHNLGVEQMMEMYERDALQNGYPAWEGLNDDEQEFVANSYKFMFQGLKMAYSELRLDCMKRLSTRLLKREPQQP